MSEPSYDHPGIVLVPDGPMLVRGVATIQDDQGVIHQVERPVVAVCRCLKSSRMPWCDATHKVIPRSRGTDPA